MRIADSVSWHAHEIIQTLTYTYVVSLILMTTAVITNWSMTGRSDWIKVQVQYTSTGIDTIRYGSSHTDSHHCNMLCISHTRKSNSKLSLFFS
jgi:hypothetical protein